MKDWFIKGRNILNRYDDKAAIQSKIADANECYGTMNGGKCWSYLNFYTGSAGSCMYVFSQ